MKRNLWFLVWGAVWGMLTLFLTFITYTSHGMHVELDRCEAEIGSSTTAYETSKALLENEWKGLKEAEVRTKIKAASNDSNEEPWRKAPLDGFWYGSVAFEFLDGGLVTIDAIPR